MKLIDSKDFLLLTEEERKTLCESINIIEEMAEELSMPCVLNNVDEIVWWMEENSDFVEDEF